MLNAASSASSRTQTNLPASTASNRLSAPATPAFVSTREEEEEPWRVGYYWANAVGIPILVLLTAASSAGDGNAWGAWVLLAFVTISGLLDRRLRGWVVRFWAWLSGFVVAGGCILGIIATMTALIAIIFVIAIVAILAFVAIALAAIYLWVNSIIMLVRTYQTRSVVRS
jgi:hypothetical protein